MTVSFSFFGGRAGAYRRLSRDGWRPGGCRLAGPLDRLRDRLQLVDPQLGIERQGQNLRRRLLGDREVTGAVAEARVAGLEVHRQGVVDPGPDTLPGQRRGERVPF